MTYDEQKAAEKAANIAIRAKTNALLAQIAKALGGNWKEQKSEDGCTNATVYGTLALDGIAVHARANGYQNTDRIRFSIEWPTYIGRDGHKQRMEGTSVLNSQDRAKYPWDITVSVAKPAATIAKDLMRRLVEPMRPVYALTLQQIKEDSERRDSEEARAAYFVQRFTNYKKSKDDGARMYPGPGGMPRVQLRESSIAFDQFHCDYDTAYKILSLLEAATAER